MRKLAADRNAISEVIGALMLTLVVVIAASSFAVFVAEKQKIEQNRQLYEVKQAAEEISVLSVNPYAPISSDDWASLNFTVTNDNSEKAIITKIMVNEFVAKGFSITRYNPLTGNYESSTLSFSDTLSIAAKETININMTSTDFFASGPSFPVTGYVKISLFTTMLNQFDQAFDPPTAIIKFYTEYQWNASAVPAPAYEPFTILDGMSSTQAGEGFIVGWGWSIDGVAGPTGGKARVDLSSGTHEIKLTVTNNNGMRAIATIHVSV